MTVMCSKRKRALSLWTAAASVVGGTGSAPCIDLDKTCPVWTEKGDCNSDASFMFTFCPVSCQACDLPRRRVELVSPQDSFSRQVSRPHRHRPITPQDLTEYDYSDERYYLDIVHDVVAADMGEPQAVPVEDKGPILNLVQRARQYWKTVFREDDCINHDASCAIQAVHGACTNSTMQEWMMNKCCPMCWSIRTAQTCSEDDDACLMDKQIGREMEAGSIFGTSSRTKNIGDAATDLV